MSASEGAYAPLTLEPVAVVEDRLAVAPDLVLRGLREAGSRDGLHRGQDAAQQVRTAGAEVLVGRVDQGLDRDLERLVSAHVALEPLLPRFARVLATGALREIVGLLVAPAGYVVLEEPSHSRSLVEASEDRDDDQPLHGHRQGNAGPLSQPVLPTVSGEVTHP